MKKALKTLTLAALLHLSFGHHHVEAREEREYAHVVAPVAVVR